jgi:hypothetical protein
MATYSVNITVTLDANLNPTNVSVNGSVTNTQGWNLNVGNSYQPTTDQAAALKSALSFVTSDLAQYANQ